jgi:hypothetical protein
VEIDYTPQIHLVELITGKNDDVLHIGIRQEMFDALPNRIGSALKPVRIVRSLLGGKDIDESAAEHVELVSLNNVLVEGRRVELGKDKNLIDLRVQTVADRNIDEPVLPAQRDRRFASELGERVQALALSAAQDHSHYILHVDSLTKSIISDQLGEAAAL